MGVVLRQEEGLSAFEVAIDRPSAKFLSFLQRHYQLHSFVKQVKGKGQN